MSNTVYLVIYNSFYNSDRDKHGIFATLDLAIEYCCTFMDGKKNFYDDSGSSIFLEEAGLTVEEAKEIFAEYLRKHMSSYGFSVIVNNFEVVLDNTYFDIKELEVVSTPLVKSALKK